MQNALFIVVLSVMFKQISFGLSLFIVHDKFTRIIFLQADMPHDVTGISYFAGLYAG